MAKSLHEKHLEQIHHIEGLLRQASKNTGLLSDMQGLTSLQKSALDSLLQGIDGCRSLEMGICRQAFGLDQDLIDLTRKIKELNS